MNMPSSIPDVVSKRNQFQPAAELVEDALPFLPEQFKHPDFEIWLLRYTESVIRSVANHLEVAAARGIQQGAALLCDPEYYSTRRERRARQRLLWAEEKAKQEREWLERKICPTAGQIKQEIMSCERQVEYYRAQLAMYEKALERLHNMTPKNIRLVPPKNVQ